MMAWALFCHDFDLSKGINILSEKCPVVLDHYKFKDKFPQLQLVTIDKDFGGWKTAQQQFFADGGVFDQIYVK